MPWSGSQVANLWRAMQAQQLLRLSLEGLLNWVLAMASDGPVTLDELVSRMIAALAVSESDRLGDWLLGDCPCEDGLDGRVSPVSLLVEIDDAPQAGRP